MKELLGRNVNIVDYYPRPFRQKDKGRFKIRLKYPFKITDIFQDNKIIKVHLKYIGDNPKNPDLRCKPLKNIDFELNDNEKKNIIEYIEENNLNQLFKKYWYLRIDTIMDFLKRDYLLNNSNNNFTVIENIGKKDHYRISFLLELYGIQKDPIKKNESFLDYCKENNVSFIFFENKKVKEIYLDKKSFKIFFFYEKNDMLIPDKDIELMKKYNGDFLVMYIDEN